jgi:hypothetical protein
MTEHSIPSLGKSRSLPIIIRMIAQNDMKWRSGLIIGFTEQVRRTMTQVQFSWSVVWVQEVSLLPQIESYRLYKAVWSMINCLEISFEYAIIECLGVSMITVMTVECVITKGILIQIMTSKTQSCKRQVTRFLFDVLLCRWIIPFQTNVFDIHMNVLLSSIDEVNFEGWVVCDCRFIEPLHSYRELSFIIKVINNSNNRRISWSHEKL